MNHNHYQENLLLVYNTYFLAQALPCPLHPLLFKYRLLLIIHFFSILLLSKAPNDCGTLIKERLGPYYSYIY